MYRILEDEGESRERRDQLVHPAYQKPELLATAPTNCGVGTLPSCGVGQVTYFYLYVILRRLQPLRRWLDGRAPGKRGTGQAVHRGDHRQAPGSRRATHHPCRPRQGHDFQSRSPFLMADWASPRPTAGLMFPTTTVFESQFRTMKYRPEFPDRFGSISRQPRLLPAVLPVVQPRASPLRHRLADPGHGSLWGDPDCPGPPPGGARRRLPTAPGPLRSAAAKTTTITIGGLDQ